MPGKDQRTEQPTQQRIKKAREDGRYPVSRDFAGGVQFAAFVVILVCPAPIWWPRLCLWFREGLTAPFRGELHVVTEAGFSTQFVLPLAIPLALAGLAVCVCGALAHLMLTGFGISSKQLSPQLSRLNPSQRLLELPRRGLEESLQTLVLLPAFCFLLWRALASNFDQYVQLPAMGLSAGATVVAASIASLLWEFSLMLLAWGAIDLFRKRAKYFGELRMTRQEVKEEWRQNEGSPEVKSRIRRLRRDLLRRRMMSEVPSATAVIMNPTHFAVALRYDLQGMTAPKVVAKGKNFLALRIREKALAHQVPVIENAPLAQALYRSVDVGGEIPAHLYRAVAEVLAYVYRMLNGRVPR